MLELVEQMLNHVPAIQDQADGDEPGDEPELLVGEAEVVKRASAAAVLEVLAGENGVVEDVGLGEVAGLAGPHVLPEIQLGDARRDLADLPPLEAGFHQLLPILLLELPHLRVHLEHLVEIRIVLLPNNFHE